MTRRPHVALMLWVWADSILEVIAFFGQHVKGEQR
jgi:hypothetical protein